jgi:uncharacterized protein DUF5996
MELFPPMPLPSWQDTKETLHRFCQVVGKVRLAASARRNHWWNVPLYVSGRGTTTRSMGQLDGNPIFAIDLNIIDHQLRISILDSLAAMVPLQGQSVASFGFWFGDDRFGEPAFYVYAAPEPGALADQRLQPAAAWWAPRETSHLAVLRYDDASTTRDPAATVLEFYESAYQAGARLAGWDIGRLACPGGITDPQLRRHLNGQRVGTASVPMQEP